MPKISWLTEIPEEQLQIENRLFYRFGGMMTVTDVLKQIGMKKRSVAQELLADVPYEKVGRSRLYAVEDVAEKLYELKVFPNA